MMTEHEIQKAVFRWCASMAVLVPGLAYAFAIPNAGKRSIRAGAWMRSEGLRAGVPDIFIPVPSKGLHGLFVEVKRSRGGKVSDKQEEWIEALNGLGYRALVCRGAGEAIEAIQEYLGLPLK